MEDNTGQGNRWLRGEGWRRSGVIWIVFQDVNV